MTSALWFSSDAEGRKVGSILVQPLVVVLTQIWLYVEYIQTSHSGCLIVVVYYCWQHKISFLQIIHDFLNICYKIRSSTYVILVISVTGRLRGQIVSVLTHRLTPISRTVENM